MVPLTLFFNYHRHELAKDIEPDFYLPKLLLFTAAVKMQKPIAFFQYLDRDRLRLRKCQICLFLRKANVI